MTAQENVAVINKAYEAFKGNVRAKYLAGIVLLIIPLLSFAQAPKQKITRAADLPTFQYPIKGKVEDLVKSEDAFRPFSAEVRKNVESILRDYEISDVSEKRSLLNILAVLDILENRDSSARGHLSEIKALEEKPVAKALSGLIQNAILDARQKSHDRSSQAYREAFRASLKNALEGLPFDLVQNEVRNLKASAEIATESLLLGGIRAQFDPVVEKTGGLSSDLAHRIPNQRFNLMERFPLNGIIAETIGTYLSAHAKDKKDIWAERDVVLDPNNNHQSINVAVWDSGVDIAIFKDQVARDASGQPAVLAYDLDARKTTGNLYPLNAEQFQRYARIKSELKGMMDLQSNVDSPEARELRQSIAKLKPEQVRSFLEDLQFYSTYSHGTHVAGIFAKGNPYARLVTSRITFEWKMTPDPCPSLALVQRTAMGVQDSVEFFKKNNVRVVNMSWTLDTAKEIESAMEKCGQGASLEERKRTAREWFEIPKGALERAIRSAPGILFVAAAGNSNSDSGFAEFIPASLKLPNLLTVGAVDKAGDEAGFTSYGPTVVVHANGFEVESFIPGGDRLKLSGTSMASPNVANLAAKILVVNPKLNPAQVIEIIRGTAEKTADGRRNLINPKKAVAAAQTR